MGHVYKIANELMQETNQSFIQRMEGTTQWPSSSSSDFFLANDNWKSFVFTELPKVNEGMKYKAETSVSGLQKWIQDHMKKS